MGGGGLVEACWGDLGCDAVLELLTEEAKEIGALACEHTLLDNDFFIFGSVGVVF